ncbi:hypothetical protein HDA32_000116 [Spinactinospora alkalitolerans]|uniref:Uncharacterized protein n=1 Tax=Spinactinospora alkalitolerans TaxID=687207 RepID=A0A852TL96_9ACTN|nr:hypothetical protein [Spinactinospora alkalitolerans]NYE44996.1 hypothetical protein [Spinactinospora alkalitolerans]
MEKLIEQTVTDLPLTDKRIARSVARREAAHGPHKMRAELITNTVAVEGVDGDAAGVIRREIPVLYGVIGGAR